MNRHETTNEVWQQAADFIDTYDTFLVVSHVQPDGDAIGSTLAMAHLLKQRGKQCILTNDSPIPKKYLFMDMTEQIVSWNAAKKAHFDAVISVDCADRLRLGAVETVLQENYPLLNIDHHPTNDHFGHVNVVLDDKSATAEILYHLTQYLQLTWDRAFAEAVYTGVMTDTGGFRYTNTSSSSMELAAHLLRFGVNPGEIAERVFENISHAKVEILKVALNSLAISDDGKIAWITITAEQMKQTGAKEEDLGGIVNFARNVEGVEVGILFKQLDVYSVKASLRSRDKVDVSKIAQKLGGGGHARAAGCTIEGSLSEVKQTLLEATREALILCQTT